MSDRRDLHIERDDGTWAVVPPDKYDYLLTAFGLSAGGLFMVIVSYANGVLLSDLRSRGNSQEEIKEMLSPLIAAGEVDADGEGDGAVYRVRGLKVIT